MKTLLALFLCLSVLLSSCVTASTAIFRPDPEEDRAADTALGVLGLIGDGFIGAGVTYLIFAPECGALIQNTYDLGQGLLLAFAYGSIASTTLAIDVAIRDVLPYRKKEEPSYLVRGLIGIGALLAFAWLFAYAHPPPAGETRVTR